MMADNTRALTLSQTYGEDNSLDYSSGSFATLSGGGSIINSCASGCPYLFSHNNNPPPPPTTSSYYILQRENMNDQPQQVSVTPSKRLKGRPFGSNNKPKPPIVIKQESENALKPVVIEIPTGNDVIEALITFARHRHVGISVLSGYGSVTNITLHNHVSRASVFPINGTFHILSLTGTYISGCFPSLSSSNLAVFPPCSSFGIRVAGSEGQVFGGVIGGKVIAATDVVVMTTVFKIPEFHRVSFINENVVEEESGEENNNNNDNAYAGVINVDHSTSVNIVPSGNTNNNNDINIMPNMSTFGAAYSTGQQNGQVHAANMNVM